MTIWKVDKKIYSFLSSFDFAYKNIYSNNEINIPGLIIPRAGCSHLTRASALERTGMSWRTSNLGW